MAWDRKYLTAEAKQMSLSMLARERARVDQCLLPYLDRINAVDGIVTIESCAGHKRWVEHQKRWMDVAGHVVLHMTKEMQATFEDLLPLIVDRHCWVQVNYCRANLELAPGQEASGLSWYTVLTWDYGHMRNALERLCIALERRG